MTHGQLFAGIGGFGLAAQWAGIENVWANEIDGFCCKVLSKNFSNLKIYERDIREIGKHNLEPVDIITGGFPCQPFSHAGKRKGKEDYRYLWPEMFRVVRDNKRKQEERGKDSWVIVENVTGLLSMGDGGAFEGVQPRVENKEIIRQEDYDQFVKIFSLEEIMLLESICQDLEQAGYSVQPYSIPACSVGAWHRRDRIWIICHTNVANSHRRFKFGEKGKIQTRRNTSNNGGQNVTNTNSVRCGRGKDRKSPVQEGKLLQGEQKRGKMGDKTEGRDRKQAISDPNSKDRESNKRKPNPKTNRGNIVGGLCQDVPDTESQGLQESLVKKPQKGTSGTRSKHSNLQPGGEAGDRPTKSKLGRMATRISDRMDGYWNQEPEGIPRTANNIKDRVNRIKGLGNAIVPQVAYEIFKAIINH